MAEYDMEDAIEKAEEFLNEHHSTIDLKSSALEHGIWHLIFDVGFLSEQLKEVKVDANSGKILGYTDVDVEEEEDD